MKNENLETSSQGKRGRFSEVERSEHLLAWKNSGLGAKTYAQKHGLSVASLYAWSRRVGSQISPPSQPQQSTPAFVPVKMLGQSQGPCSLPTARVILQQGQLQCIIEGAADANSFADIASALKRRFLDV